MEEFNRKLRHSVNTLRKIFYNFFEHHQDFDKSEEEVINGITDMVKKEIQSIYLLDQYVNEVIFETFKKYKLRSESNKSNVIELLQNLYSQIIETTYSFIYPNSWV